MNFYAPRTRKTYELIHSWYFQVFDLLKMFKQQYYLILSLKIFQSTLIFNGRRLICKLVKPEPTDQVKPSDEYSKLKSEIDLLKAEISALRARVNTLEQTGAFTIEENRFNDESFTTTASINSSEQSDGLLTDPLILYGMQNGH